jgi:ATP-dependent DNA helicase RecG
VGESLDRLRLVARTQDGFRLAEADLAWRGSGNLLGTQQSGLTAFRSARMTDVELMTAAREEAERFLAEDPALAPHPYWKQIVDVLRQTAHLE